MKEHRNCSSLAFSDLKNSKIDRTIANLVFLNHNLKKKFHFVLSLGGIQPL